MTTTTTTTAAAAAAAAAPAVTVKRTAPKMSRPVGHYYAAAETAAATAIPPSTSTSTTTTTATYENTTSGRGYYGAAAAPATSHIPLDEADQWDWNTPAVASSDSSPSDWYGATATTAPMATTTTVTATKGGAAKRPAVPVATTSTTGTTNFMYTSSGFYGAAAAAASTTQTNNNNSSTNMMDSSNSHDLFLSGSMDDQDPYSTTNPAPATKPSIFQPQTFIPRASATTALPNGAGNSNGSLGDLMSVGGGGGGGGIAPDEAPLLEELGINLAHIFLKTKAVVLPFGRFGGTQMQPSDIVQDADLAGPIAFALILGAEMVLTGRFQFGYIYGFGVFGCVSMTLIVNLMTSVANGISIWTVSSVLGYALIPVNLLAAVKLIVMNVIQLQTLGRILGLVTVAWSTVASTRLLEMGCGLREQRYLIAYPIALLYSAFVMITIF